MCEYCFLMSQAHFLTYSLTMKKAMDSRMMMRITSMQKNRGPRTCSTVLITLGGKPN